MALALRQRQKEAFLRMLDSVGGAPAASSATSADGAPAEEVYKVLVLDRPCRDVVSPLVRVPELRRHGVTLHLLLESERQPIPEVPALYFCAPSEACVRRIGKDLAGRLYASAHCHFAAPLPRPALEALAAEAVRAEALPRVARVVDQHLGFVCLEPRCFSLGLPRAFVQLNDPAASEHAIQAVIADIVTGLFSVLVTAGCVPLIRAARGGAAEQVARELEGRLREALAQRGGVFAAADVASPGGSRPLLVLLDRSFDLAPPVQHVWTYAPLAADVLGMRLNRVTLGGGGAAAPPAGGTPAAKKSFELDVETDPFWAAQLGAPFPKVAEEVEAELGRYKAAVTALNRAAEAAAGGLDAAAPTPSASAAAAAPGSLLSAVSSLPELSERKRLIDKHTNIATALLSAIKARGLDSYAAVEEELLCGRGDKAAVAQLLSADAKGSPEDKVRLAIVAALAAEGAAVAAEAEATDAALRAAGADVAPLAYVRQMRAFNLTAGTGGGGGGALGGGLGGGGGTSGATGTQGNLLDWADKLYGQGLTAVTKGVKSLLAGTRQLGVVRVLDALLESRPGSEADTFLTLDPRAPRGASASAAAAALPSVPPPPGGAATAAGGPPGPPPRRDAIVFVVGGGCHLEARALAEAAARPTAAGGPPRAIAYGATEMVSGPEFLAQLAELARGGGAGLM